MDYKPYVDYAVSHAPTFIAGAILTRPVLAADLAFKAVINTPAKRLIVWNWPTISKWIDDVQDQFGKDVEKEKAAEAAPPAPAPAAPPPPAAP